jgi:hypothetical protein
MFALLEQLIKEILSDPEVAADFAADQYGTLAACGITQADLDGADVRSLVADAAKSSAVSDHTREALGNYTNGASGPPAGANVIEHINYVTYATYEGDHHYEYITRNITNFDNSTDVDVDVDGDIDGDFRLDIDNTQDIDQTNVSADDGGVANVGDGDVNAATGDDSLLIDGDNEGLANAGDGAAQVGDDGQANSGDNAVQVGDDLDGLVNTGAIGDGNADDDDFQDSFNETQVDAQDSIVGTEQGEGDLDQEDAELEQEQGAPQPVV